MLIRKRELLEMIYGMWEQFAYEDKQLNGEKCLWSGGLSSLESCENWLLKYGYIEKESGFATKKLTNIISNRRNKHDKF
jgi:hypothetical protein